MKIQSSNSLNMGNYSERVVLVIIVASPYQAFPKESGSTAMLLLHSHLK